MRFFKDNAIELIIALVALIIAIFLPLSGIASLADWTGSGQITQSNQAFLEDASEAGLRDTLLLGEVSAFLEILRSTDFGIELIVSVDVQAGQAISTLVKAVEWAMLAAASGTILSETLLWVNGLTGVMSLGLLKLGGVAVVFWMVLRILEAKSAWRSIARGFVEVIGLVFLTTYLILPYSINLGGWLTETPHGALYSDAASTVENFHSETLGDSGLDTDLDFWTKSSEVKNAYEGITANLADKVASLTLFALRSMAHMLVVGILFPFLVAVVMVVILRRLFGPILGQLENELDAMKGPAKPEKTTD